MARISKSFASIVLLFLAIPALAAPSKEPRLYLGVGMLSYNYSRPNKPPASSFLGDYKYYPFNLTLRLGGEKWAFWPEMGYTFLGRSAENTTESRIFFFQIPVERRFYNRVGIHLGPGFLIYYLKGSGGDYTESLPGTTTISYAQPEDTHSSSNMFLEAGLSLYVKRFRFCLNAFSTAPFSSQRSYSFLASLNFALL